MLSFSSSEMRYAIWCYLYNLQFKKRENTRDGVLLLVKWVTDAILIFAIYDT